MNFCPYCAEPLIKKQEFKNRLACSRKNCNFVFWNNPIPVVAGIIETKKGVVLSNNKLWPPEIYSMTTGFLDHGEAPEDAIVREVAEELGLMATVQRLIGVYSYSAQNQVIIVYHVWAEGMLSLGDEIKSIRIYSKDELCGWPFGLEKAEGWPFGAGWAIRDWLESEVS